MYILNQVPTKIIPKMPFELLKGWESSLRHVCVYRCTYEVGIYNPQEKKLDPRIISECLVTHVERYKSIDFTVHLIVLGL